MNNKKVLELDLSDPMKLAFAVKELMEILTRAIGTADCIGEHCTDEVIQELGKVMASGIRVQIQELFEAVATEVDADDPDVIAAIAEAKRTGNPLVEIKPRPTPKFSFTAPNSEVTN